MKVIAKSNVISDSLHSVLGHKTKLKYPVQVGSVYTVVGLTMEIGIERKYPLNGVFIYSEKEHILNSITAEILEVVDPTIPSCWEIGNGFRAGLVVMAPRDLIDNKFLIEDLHDGIPSAIRIMNKILELHALK